MIPGLELRFFSGTGNSYRVATWMAAEAGRRGLNPVIGPLNGTCESLAPGDGPLGVFFPTHGFTAPWIVLRSVWRLPRGEGRPAFTVATRAGLVLMGLHVPGVDGTAAWITAALLALKGYRLMGAYAVDMPSSWIALHSGLPPRHVDSILERAQAKTSRIAAGILLGRPAGSAIWSLIIGLALLPLSIAYLLLGRFGLARLFFSDADCNGCSSCAEHCPVGAITMRSRDGKRHPRWSIRCESCQRCMVYCPTKSIQAGWPWMAAVGGSAFGTAAWLTASFPWPVRFVAENGAFLMALMAARPLLERLGSTIVPGRLLAFPTRFYRRYHEPRTSASELGGARSTIRPNGRR